MRWTRLRHRLRAAFASLPLECLAVAVTVAGLWWMVATRDTAKVAQGMFFSGMLAVPLFYAVTMLRRAGRLAAGGAVAMSAVAAAAAIAVGATHLDHDKAFVWQVGLGLLAACMLPFVAAAIGPRTERLVRFADFVRRFSEETTASLLLCGAAVLATAVLFISVRELFGLNVERLGVDTGGAIVGLCVLAYLHRLLADGGPARVPELWRRLIGRVAAPFLVATLVLLVIYELTVIARGELPANLVSPLIIAAGAIGFASTLVIESLVAVRGERLLSPAEPHPWTAARSVRLSRGFAAVLLALLPLAAWALWVRIDQHGLTPARAARAYALACLGVLALWGTARWLRRRRPLTWEVPVAVGVTALVAAIGPLSAVDLSIRSQAARLEQALAQAGVPGRVVMAHAPDYLISVDQGRRDEISDRIGALVELGGADALGQVLTGHLETCPSRWDLNGCLLGLGIEVPAYKPGDGAVWLHAAEPEVAGFRYIEVATSRPARDPVLGLIELRADGDRLIALREGRPWASAPLRDLDRWVADRRAGAIPPLQDDRGCLVGHVLARSAAVLDRKTVEWLDVILLVLATPRCQ